MGNHVKGRLRGGRGNESGFSIVELLIALFITGIVAAAIYGMYTQFYKQSTTADLELEARQNARVALNFLEGELINVGYGVTSQDVITLAQASSMTFRYANPSDPAAGTLEVTYALDGSNNLLRTVDNLSDASPPESALFIPNVNSLSFVYYDVDGNAVAAPISTQTDRNTVKFINVSLVTETDALPGGSTKTYTLSTQVRLRNIGAGQTASDTTAPSAPTGLQVRDAGKCGRLKVKWNKNSEGDVTGYKIYYGTSTGTYTGVLNIPISSLTSSTYSCTSSGSTISCDYIVPSSPALSYTASNAASPTTYYVAVKAYDNSMNYSAYSTEVSGNPDPSNSTLDSGSNDTTINPVKPSAVTGLTSVDGSADGEVALSWSAYNTSSNPDVVGFRVYRKESAFTSYPIDPTATGITWIAGEPGSGKPELSQTATSYTDTGRTGCRTYYYAIAPVNCDTTLIVDNGSDPDSKKYIQTDYTATCGDGTSSCTPGTGFSAITGADTAPDDSTSPPAPTGFNARAGWRRVAISFTQADPGDNDLSQTCLYSNETATYPGLRSDTASYPKLDGCYQVDTTSTPGAIRLFESGGIYTASELSEGASTSFWHNSMTALTSTPSLLDTGTYSYRAVSFDLCGNASGVTGAQATTTLCGEDPTGKPSASPAASASYCSSPVTLNWTEIPSDLGSPSSASNPYDLAGYRIFRSTSSSDWSAATLLNTDAPYWGGSYSDAGITDGGTYYYRVVTTDCPYEKGDDTGGVAPGEAQIRTNMNSGFLSYRTVGPVYPGKLDRDEKCPGSGTCTQDDHRQVLTGVSVDSNNASTPNTDSTHHTVMLFLNNTGATKMIVQSISVQWVNSSALLKKVKIGGGRSGVSEISTDISTTPTAITGNPPYTLSLSDLALTSTEITAGARYVPLRLDFKDASDNAVDMREDQLLITLKYMNNESGTTGCTSYMTVSESSEGIFVPLGPTITATQQDEPSSPTFGYAVPGASGFNTVPNGSNAPTLASSGTTVTVSASIAGNTTDETTGGKVAVSSATLYYRATANTVTTAPTSGFTSVTMTNTGGNNWSGDIPSSDGNRIWYYIRAIDADGNFDRDPEPSHGAYVYDQASANPCSVTPSAPTGLATSVAGMNVTLTWNAVTTYTNGNSIMGGDSIQYRIYRGATLLATQAGLSYTDALSTTGVYQYTVYAINSCASPGPMVSSVSNTSTACVGLSGQASISVSPSSIYVGGSYSVTIVDCLAANSTYGYDITTQIINSTGGFTGYYNSSTLPHTFSPTISETGPATATFTQTVGTTTDVSDSTKLHVSSTGDTVTVYYPYASPSSTTVTVSVDPCNNTPKAPATMTGSTSGQNMTLTWGAVTQNTDNSAITDLAGYRIYEKVCTNSSPVCSGANLVADWFLRGTVAAGTTSTTISADQGNLSQRKYYFKATAYDSCATPNASAYSPQWAE